MTKKDYVIIANVLRDGIRCGQDSTMDELIRLFCLALKQDNPKFDKEKFESFMWRK